MSYLFIAFIWSTAGGVAAFQPVVLPSKPACEAAVKAFNDQMPWTMGRKAFCIPTDLEPPQ